MTDKGVTPGVETQYHKLKLMEKNGNHSFGQLIGGQKKN